MAASCSYGDVNRRLSRRRRIWDKSSEFVQRSQRLAALVADLPRRQGGAWTLFRAPTASELVLRDDRFHIGLNVGGGVFDAHLVRPDL